MGMWGIASIDRSLVRRGIETLAYTQEMVCSMGRREEDVRIAVARGSLADVPLEFVGEVARARAMAETSDIESCATTARHDVCSLQVLSFVVVERKMEFKVSMQSSRERKFRVLASCGSGRVHANKAGAGNSHNCWLAQLPDVL